jgi:hypothetical protein
VPGYIDIQIIGDTAGVEAMLQHLQLKLLPPNIAAFLHVEVDPYLAQRAANRFANEGDDVVGAWPQLQPGTQAIRASQGFGDSHPINVRTGELERYIVSSGGAVATDPSGAELTFPGAPASGELADKVQTAQAGRGVPPTVPRPVLGLNQNDLLAVLTSTALYIQAP